MTFINLLRIVHQSKTVSHKLYFWSFLLWPWSLLITPLINLALLQWLAEQGLPPFQRIWCVVMTKSIFSVFPLVFKLWFQPIFLFCILINYSFKRFHLTVFLFLFLSFVRSLDICVIVYLLLSSKCRLRFLATIVLRFSPFSTFGDTWSTNLSRFCFKSLSE